MKPYSQLAATLVACTIAAHAWADPKADEIRHGRYLIATSGCNDCHTPGFMIKDGHVPESEWLTGDAMGWQGPWGTTYPANLRRVAAALSEDQWVTRARAPMRPPMPAPSLRAMSENDLRAIYRYIKSLPVKGEVTPAYVPPGGTVTTPYFDLTPKNMSPQVAAGSHGNKP
jgi:mono/diheme cytochrome c family protein